MLPSVPSPTTPQSPVIICTAIATIILCIACCLQADQYTYDFEQASQADDWTITTTIPAGQSYYDTWQDGAGYGGSACITAYNPTQGPYEHAILDTITLDKAFFEISGLVKTTYHDGWFTWQVGSLYIVRRYGKYEITGGYNFGTWLVNDWNRFLLRCIDGHIYFYINNEMIFDGTDKSSLLADTGNILSFRVGSYDNYMYIDNLQITTTAPEQSAYMYTFRTIDDLKAIEYPLDGAQAHVAWRNEPGDNGGGTFIFDAQDVTAADGGTIFQPDGITGPGRWKRLYRGAVSPSWFKNPTDSDDTAAVQTAFDNFPHTQFDRNYEVTSVNIAGSYKTIQGNGYRLSSVDDSTAVLEITGRNLMMYNMVIQGNYNTHTNGAVWWHSVDGKDPAQYNRIYGLTIYSSRVGLLFGANYDGTPNNRAQSENHVFGFLTRNVDKCIHVNMLNGFLFVVGGTIDCNDYTDGVAQDDSRCFEVRNGVLRISDCEIIRTTTQQGYMFEGPAEIADCHFEAPTTWGLITSGRLAISNCVGYFGNDSKPLFELDDNTTPVAGHCTISSCSFRRAPVITYSGAYIFSGENPDNDYDVYITDTTFNNWRYDRVIVHNSTTPFTGRLHMDRVSFPESSTVTNRDFVHRMFPGVRAPEILVGQGDPLNQPGCEAYRGSLYLRTDADAFEPNVYIKEHDAGDNGRTDYWQPAQTGGSGYLISDLNKDSHVDLLDFAIFTAQWQQSTQ